MLRRLVKTIVFNAHSIRSFTPPPSLLNSLSSSPSYSDTHFVSSKDYLVSSLSLSPESVETLKIIKRRPIFIRCTSNADSVIALFKVQGFSDTQIATILCKCPNLLKLEHRRVLKPKLEFLAESGISVHVLLHILTTDPLILQRSLHDQIAPCVHFLKTFFHNDLQTTNSFLLQKRASFMIRGFTKHTPVNVETLRCHGVPDSSILRLFLLGGGPSRLAQDAHYFNTNLKEIKEMGFDLSCAMFPHGINVFSAMSREKWVSKMEVIKKCFGWNNDQQVLALFVKQSAFMNMSEDKLRQRLDFFMKRLGWTPDYIAKYSTLLAFSLEKRILPRVSVLEILRSKGLVKNTGMGSAFLLSEDRFLSVFVDKRQKYLPEIQLKEIYTNSMQNSKLGG